MPPATSPAREARRPEGEADHGARHRPHRRVVADGVRHVVDVEVVAREGPADHDPAVAMALDEDDLAQPWRVVRPPASVRVGALGALDVIEGEHRKLPGVLAPARGTATAAARPAPGRPPGASGRAPSRRRPSTIHSSRPKTTTASRIQPRKARTSCQAEADSPRSAPPESLGAAWPRAEPAAPGHEERCQGEDDQHSSRNSAHVAIKRGRRQARGVIARFG